MECKESRDGNVLVAAISGRIDGTSAPTMETAVLDLVQDSDEAVICDMTDMPYVSSAGLRSTLIIAKKLAVKGVKFMVCNLGDQPATVFRESGFHKIINNAETLEAALAKVREA
ncbi:MAG: STAS domain-containing protein [Boseongicola sp.]|nr:STAS domain-containing protein [Boseongicola sp.]